MSESVPNMVSLANAIENMRQSPVIPSLKLADSVALKKSMQQRAREARNSLSQSVQTGIQRQQRMLANANTSGLLSAREHWRMRISGPYRHVVHKIPIFPFRNRFIIETEPLRQRFHALFCISRRTASVVRAQLCNICPTMLSF